MVIVPALDQDTDSWASLVRKLSNEDGYTRREADFLCVDHGLSALSHRSMAEVVRAVHASVDAKWHAHHGYAGVVLVGHSAGGLFARAAYLMGRGALKGDSVTPSTWANHVNRIVLLAGVSRGIQLGGTLPAMFSEAAERTFGIGGSGYVFQSLLRGAPFVANVRVSWITLHQRDAERQKNDVIFVQALGVRDKLISVDDSFDVMTLPNALQLYVPGADHGDLPLIDGTENPDERYAELRRGFLDRRRENASAEQDTTKQHVIFLLHGIRSGITGWQESLKDSLATALGDTARNKIIQPAYGYFTARQFMSEYQRNRHLARILDEYAEAKWRYPKASFDVVAHSNGTYLLGEALRLTPAVAFRRIYIAGSVLPPTYDWKSIKLRGQAATIVNADGAGDYPVAMLSQAVRTLGDRGVGASGVLGFVGTETEFVWALPGGHEAALAPPMLPRIGRYLRDGVVPCRGAERAACGIDSTTEARLEKYQGYARITPPVVTGLAGGIAYVAWRDVYHGFERPWRNPDGKRALSWLVGTQLFRIVLSII